MQSVSSLIGAGTAVAAAATGLAFGQLADDQQDYTPHARSSSIRRILRTDRRHSNPRSTSRPGTSSAASTAPSAVHDQTPVSPLRHSPVSINASSAEARGPRRASYAHATPSKPPPSRHSVAKQADLVFAPPTVDDCHASVSSGGSWIRRLSIRPLSQHGSLRSSIGQDSPSLFSFGSTAPILSGSRDAPSQLPPNKLVKRAPVTDAQGPALPKQRRSRPQMTLRRPATSHQRSATLQHQLNAEELPPLPKFSFDHQPTRPRAKTVGAHQPQPALGATGNARSRWKSFWHLRLSNNTTKATPLRNPDNSAQPLETPVHLDEHAEAVFLVTPNRLVVNGCQKGPNGPPRDSDSLSHTKVRDSPQDSGKALESAEMTPSKEPRRSLSMQFSSPTDWISRAGSLRRRKRGETMGTQRYAVGKDLTQGNKSTAPEEPSNGKEVSQAEADLAAIFHPPASRYASPPPLPALSPLSRLHLGENRTGSSSLISPYRGDDDAVSPSISSRVNSNASHTRTLERASTVGSSEYHNGFTSGDDDDADSKTDTPFDSFRTMASDRKRALDSPLDSMFDESLPSTSGNNSKPKRLSIQEILGPSSDISNKIMEEEEENVSSLVRGNDNESMASFGPAHAESGKRSVQKFGQTGFGPGGNHSLLPLDDDDDDLGWARPDETEIYNQLSPPGSMNPRRGSPNVRAEFRKNGDNSKRDVHFDSTGERPRSTVFDWAEPPLHDKREKNGLVHRPKTAHGKQELDLRGGRSASRKIFIAAHVRSQSVPVVPDPTEATTKSAPKFGTWGLGQKNVSEDWDDDFEFEEEMGSGIGSAGINNENGVSMLVPASIQATQPTVKAHSGHIRELSLLVNDLKRLCRLGREMSMLGSSSAKLWHEAEGIIALASPDEDTESTGAETGDESKPTTIDERFIDKGFDGASLEVKESPQDRNSPSSRRRSVFSPEDDIFGTWDHIDPGNVGERPRTPENPMAEPRSTSVARSVMASMRKHRTTFNVNGKHNDDDDDDEHYKKKMNFDTNSLKELVKRAGDLRDSLSELVRREDHITQSPARTPKRTRPDGSPAFTRVFDDPSSSPTRRLSHVHNKPGLTSTSVSTSPSNGISRRMQMMIVS
ncbi:hypothetical protein F5Y14DRAFT_276150 [Nemania sp. NC0429]|nr:hypothetical protein F5Y14DRAFT_276150 [Nemania sp. NC0429]